MNVPTAIPKQPVKKKVQHEFIDFSTAYRIGILGIYTETNQVQQKILAYQKELEKLGFECEVLLFVNEKEKNTNVFFPSFNLTELNKEGMPNSPRTDRFVVRRFDLLLNLFFEPCKQLIHITAESNAKCRVSPYIDFLTDSSDILIPTDSHNDIQLLIKNINETLKLQPYVRPQI